MDRVSEDSKCPRHPDQAVVDICCRCGSFICGECKMLSDQQEALCEPCYSLIVKGKASSRAVAALVLALIGLQGLFFLGIPAIVISIRELRAIDSGESSVSGRSLAKGALILGCVEIGLLLLLMVIILIMIFN